ncbi:glucose dehydrogenase [FAD, quinone]-like [Zerene cesonia]|uniref:glucose dehydrogenase [FAD, quinone]-like n=1 Tax=Zerene cesonia TaxID=33412 RepID=UPI0018E549EB|nr:glucose dehydrogenase [FAD, quinone]-like [Zerene cesonia]
MSPIHLFQFFLFSLCVHIFTVYIYIVYYTDFFYSTQDIESEYDFIIVGSGTAGSLIAHRLSTQTNHTFIVIEAGGNSNPLFEIPIFGPLLHGSVYDWQYDTVRQDKACLAMVGNKCRHIQGRMLGGSSKINNMIHVTGNISYYVDWFHGKYSEQYIKEQFNFIENNILQLSKLQFSSELSANILKAAEQLGYGRIKSDFKVGFSEPILSQVNGKRWAISDILVNKYVRVNTLVEKLLIGNNKCVGVQLANKRVYAKKGVILSAGTYNSPKLLQLSGIGPRSLLKSLGIPLVKELPVGKNLQDHVGTGLDLVLFNELLSLNSFSIYNPWHIFQYFIFGKGPYTTPGCEAIGFISTKNSSQPDVEFMVLPVGISSDKGSHLRKSFVLKEDVWNNYFAKVFDKHAITILATLLHPKSRGEVSIQSKDPHVPPLIDPKYFANAEDVKTLIDAVKFIKKIVSTEAMVISGAFLNDIPFPGCQQHDFFSNSYLECYVRHLTLSSFHPVGTCSMGLTDAKNAVVDTSFKVIGIDNLYVVDGSVLPTMPSGNINAAIAMMANIFFDSNIKRGTDLRNKCLVSCQSNFMDEFVFKVCPSHIKSL